MSFSVWMFFIKESIEEDFTAITEYLTRQVTWTLEHPLRTMDKDDIQSFLKGTLQIYVEFWNATDPPFGEYSPEFPSEDIIIIIIIYLFACVYKSRNLTVRLEPFS